MSTPDDDDFFVEDEPIEDLLTAFEAGPHVVSEVPAHRPQTFLSIVVQGSGVYLVDGALAVHVVPEVATSAGRVKVFPSTAPQLTMTEGLAHAS